MPLVLPKCRCLLCGVEGHTFHTCPKYIFKQKEIMKQTLATEEKELEQRGTDSEHQALLDEKKEEQVEELMKEEAINQPNATVQIQGKELIMHKSDLEDAQEKVRGLQTPLDNSYKEIAEQHRSNASQDSKAQETDLSAETHVREALEAAMEREQQRFEQEEEEEAFIKQIDSLKGQIAILDDYHDENEVHLRKEIAHLQERLQKDETKSQDLTHSVTSAMLPLLRQIENLQATLGAQSAAWERVEKNLDRLAQIALAMAQGKERTANDHLLELSARVALLEAANKQEKTQLAAEVKSDRSELEELQDIGNSAVSQLESSKQRLNEQLNEQLKMDKVLVHLQPFLPCFLHDFLVSKMYRTKTDHANN